MTACDPAHRMRRHSAPEYAAPALVRHGSHRAQGREGLMAPGSERCSLPPSRTCSSILQRHSRHEPSVVRLLTKGGPKRAWRRAPWSGLDGRTRDARPTSDVWAGFHKIQQGYRRAADHHGAETDHTVTQTRPGNALPAPGWRIPPQALPTGDQGNPTTGRRDEGDSVTTA